jgi:hypothetical protein
MSVLDIQKRICSFYDEFSFLFCCSDDDNSNSFLVCSMPYIQVEFLDQEDLSEPRAMLDPNRYVHGLSYHYHQTS